MGMTDIDILVYPPFRRSADHLLELLSEGDYKKIDENQLNAAAKKWLSTYYAARAFIDDSPFKYTNMYLFAIRKACEKGELNVNSLVEAFGLWITSLYLFQKSYNEEDTESLNIKNLNF